MDIESVLKLAGLVVTIFGLPKVWKEIQQISDSRLKGDFAYAKEFTEAMKNGAHPFSVEIGFRAFHPSGQLNAPEILYLLSFSQPSRAANLFLRARKRLRFIDGVPDGHSSIGFEPKYQSERKRYWLKRWYEFAYFVSALAALTPLVFLAKFLSTPTQALLIGVFPLITLGGLAYIMLMQLASLYAAEGFLDLQRSQAHS